MKFYAEDKFVLSQNNEMRFWIKMSDGKWFMQHESSFEQTYGQDEKITQIITGVNLKLTQETEQEVDGASRRCLVFLHSSTYRDSVLTFWNEETLQFVKRVPLKNKIRHVIVDKSNRYFATLTEQGSVDVWKLTGHDAKLFWSLAFQGVRQIEVNTCTENQFFVMMNSENKADHDADSILLFQFSRP